MVKAAILLDCVELLKKYVADFWIKIFPEVKALFEVKKTFLLRVSLCMIIKAKFKKDIGAHTII